MMRFCGVLIVFLSYPVQASMSPFSLQEAIRFAFEHSPFMDTAKKHQTIRELENKNAFAKFLPSLNFSATHGLQNNLPLEGLNGNPSLFTPNQSDPWYSTLNFGISEVLYDNGVSLTQYSVSSLNSELARLNYLKTRDQLVLDIVCEFYNYSLAMILFEVRSQQQRMLEKQFKTLSSYYQQGFKTKSDFLRIKTQVQRAEIDQVIAENNIQLSLVELRKLLGVNHRDEDPPSFRPILVNRNQSIKKDFPEKPPFFENIYDYQIVKIQEKVNEKSVALTKRNYWPQVIVTSGFSYYNQNYLNSSASFSSGSQLAWNALVTLRYNIWDWGIRRRTIEIAECNRDIQSNGMSQNLMEIHAKIAKIMADLLRISHNYKLTQELLLLEEESNKNLEVQYREGKVAYLDLVTSLNNLLDAKVQFYTSYFDALRMIAQYKFYEGSAHATYVEE